MSQPNHRLGAPEPVFPSDVGKGLAPVLPPATPNGAGDAKDTAAADLARMRHELNNHLTAALAEVQLLLMDVDTDELRESYEIIQESLRGMRAAVAAAAP